MPPFSRVGISAQMSRSRWSGGSAQAEAMTGWGGPIIMGVRDQREASLAVGLVYDPLYLEHDTGSHPENASRLTAILSLLEGAGLLDRLQPIEARDATVEEV